MKDILEQVQQLSKNHKKLWFRGHASTSYKLNSGLCRISKNTAHIRESENNIYNSFLNYGDFACEKYRDHQEWNILFLMQHYGLYTRLLDWTDSFITALYFANYGRKEGETACIWILDPMGLNNNCTGLYEKEVDEAYDQIRYLTLDTLPSRIKNYKNYFEKDIHIKSFAMMPRRSNDRLVSQNGFFTVQGTEGIPLEEEYAQHLGNFIYKIELPPETYEDTMNFLKLNGINYYSLFGGVEGLCKYIKDELLEIKLRNK
ncbi:FRG domain-containing protein [Bacillus manliponensis]|uniref:FRG domain-containing protein n=1 Tax=Bacillus manliponensis TaxID=574376 RepID=UPI003511FD8F